MHPLDNVIWQALTTRQSEFAEAFGEARRFQPEVTSLTALLAPNAKGYSSLGGLLASGATALLSLATPYEPQPGWNLVLTFPGLQMVCEDSHDHEAAEISEESSRRIIQLGGHDSPEMVDLAAMTKPGPFGTRTHELGTYLGIRQEGQLVAMAGERLKVPGYTEVSAVCTHPEHTGKGYARILMAEIMRQIRKRGEIPFLHVRKDNSRAIELYERLGFRTNAVVHFTVLRKV